MVKSRLVALKGAQNLWDRRKNQIDNAVQPSWWTPRSETTTEWELAGHRQPVFLQSRFVVPSVALVAKYVSTAETNAHVARKYSPISKLLVLSLIQPTMKGPT